MPRRNDREPLSAAVADRFRRAITDGAYPKGAKLPPEPELAEQTGVSRATLREALRVLEREGLLTRRQRTGTVVSSRPTVRHSLERNFSVRETIESSGKEYGVRDAQIRFVAAADPIADALAVSAGTPLTLLERTRTADGRPVVFTRDYLESRLVERATAPLLPDVSFYEWLKTYCGVAVTHGLARIEAVQASSEVAARLAIEADEPLFKLAQIDYAADAHPVLFSEELHVADAFEVTVVRTGPYL